MTPVPDFENLVNGVLTFPSEVNATGRPANALDRLKIRFADAETWREWANADRAKLWQLVALSVHLDPATLKWAELPKAPATVGSAFHDRLKKAVAHAMAAQLRTVDGAPMDEDQAVGALVRCSDYALWSHLGRTTLPAGFPGCDGLPADARAGTITAKVPSKSIAQQPAPLNTREAPPRQSLTTPAVRRAPIKSAPQATPTVPSAPPVAAPVKPRSKRTATAGSTYLREADILGHFVPFSKATLWRKVKLGTYPEPVKLSEGVTAWHRADVLAWNEAREKKATKGK